jgi:hypothetical protein
MLLEELEVLVGYSLELAANEVLSAATLQQMLSAPDQ